PQGYYNSTNVPLRFEHVQQRSTRPTPAAHTPRRRRCGEIDGWPPHCAEGANAVHKPASCVARQGGDRASEFRRQHRHAFSVTNLLKSFEPASATFPTRKVCRFLSIEPAKRNCAYRRIKIPER